MSKAAAKSARTPTAQSARTPAAQSARTPAAQSARTGLPTTAGKVGKVGKEKAPRNAFASFADDDGNEEPDAASALLNSFSRLAVSDAAQGIWRHLSCHVARVWPAVM